MPTHTPGPWTLSGLDIEANGKRVASASWRKTRPASMKIEGEEGEANARLIAAAPEMLAIIRESILLYESDCLTNGADSDCGHCVPCRARALLARLSGDSRTKVEGTTPKGWDKVEGSNA